MKRKPNKRVTAARACQRLQLYVKLLETDENGYGKCCSCGEVKAWGELQGGHFQPKGRNYNAACLEEDNVHIQCTTCNLYRGGNPAGYLKYMLAEYGAEAVEEIAQMSYGTLTMDEIQDLAKIYKEKCKRLANTKMFKVTVK